MKKLLRDSAIAITVRKWDIYEAEMTATEKVISGNVPRQGWTGDKVGNGHKTSGNMKTCTCVAPRKAIKILIHRIPGSRMLLEETATEMIRWVGNVS